MTGLNIYAARFNRLSPLGVAIVSGGPLEISNTELRDLDAFAGLVYVPGDIWIRDNPLLENIDGLKDMQFAGRLSIAHNPSLAHLPPFSGLKTLSALEVSDNDSLVEIPAFPFTGAGAGGQDPLSLISRSSALAVITDNAALSSITLPEIWLGGSALIIDKNPALAQVNLTQQLSYDYLSITGNPALASWTSAFSARSTCSRSSTTRSSIPASSAACRPSRRACPRTGWLPESPVRAGSRRPRPSGFCGGSRSRARAVWTAPPSADPRVDVLQPALVFPPLFGESSAAIASRSRSRIGQDGSGAT